MDEYNEKIKQLKDIVEWADAHYEQMIEHGDAMMVGLAENGKITMGAAGRELDLVLILTAIMRRLEREREDKERREEAVQ